MRYELCATDDKPPSLDLLAVGTLAGVFDEEIIYSKDGTSRTLPIRMLAKSPSAEGSNTAFGCHTQ
jgi:hypothetical protein